MYILAFETSCDDTSIAIFEDSNLLSMHTASQIHIHSKTGGVVPEVASREHANSIFPVLDEVLLGANITLSDIDFIAVTTHPGLVPSLLTGITVASTISKLLDIPIIPINHIEAHIFANYLERSEEDILYPAVCLTVSGGHNEIYAMSDMWKREKIGQTGDDAAGEAFDKVAKMMGLGYPGGPIISKLALEYQKPKNTNTKTLFPRVYLKKQDFQFSFSGLKSAVKREIDSRGELSQEDKREISYEFQAAVNEVLSDKLIRAAKRFNAKTVLLTGGVSANDNLRLLIEQKAKDVDTRVFYPVKKIYCMDNAAMIGILAYYKIKYKNFTQKTGVVQVGES